MEPDNERLLHTARLSRVDDPAVESFDVEHARHAFGTTKLPEELRSRGSLRGATQTIMKITSPNLEQQSILSAIGATVPKERDVRRDNQ